MNENGWPRQDFTYYVFEPFFAKLPPVYGIKFFGQVTFVFGHELEARK